MGWDAEDYDRRFSFVTESGVGLVDLLDPQPGETVVDLGCGTGHLTAEIAARGARVEGVDADAAMVARARAEHPDLAFRRDDARTFDVAEPVDAVFSNATLHWLPEADQPKVLANVRRVLRPGGRLVAEMGGAGNMARVVDAVAGARAAVGLGPVHSPWCFPTPAEQTGRLRAAGFADVRATHFARPSVLVEGATAADWVVMFGRAFTADVPAEVLPALLAEVDRRAVDLRRPDGRWVMDYVRLRLTASAD